MLVYLGTWIREAGQVCHLRNLDTPILFSYFEVDEMEQVFQGGKSWGYHWDKTVSPFLTFKAICEGKHDHLFSLDRSRS